MSKVVSRNATHCHRSVGTVDDLSSFCLHHIRRSAIEITRHTRHTRELHRSWPLIVEFYSNRDFLANEVITKDCKALSSRKKEVASSSLNFLKTTQGFIPQRLTTRLPQNYPRMLSVFLTLLRVLCFLTSH